MFMNSENASLMVYNHKDYFSAKKNVMFFRVRASLCIRFVFNAVHEENKYRPGVADSFPLPTGLVQTAKE